jgi:hypothetical protein
MQLQVLDDVMNKLFNDQLQQLYSEWPLIGDYVLTCTGEIKRPNVAVLSQ